ncbi:MAG: hypothetical protein HOI03_09135, partial [Candidatus Marinimicrobia bacterium]|nr:hypothetical protein [Candidatus Neomarinimicrobiota bacterium]
MKEQVIEDKKVQKQQNNFNNALITATESAVRRLKSVMKADGKDNHILRMSV